MALLGGFLWLQEAPKGAANFLFCLPPEFSSVHEMSDNLLICSKKMSCCENGLIRSTPRGKGDLPHNYYTIRRNCSLITPHFNILYTHRVSRINGLKAPKNEGEFCWFLSGFLSGRRGQHFTSVLTFFLFVDHMSAWVHLRSFFKETPRYVHIRVSQKKSNCKNSSSTGIFGSLSPIKPL